MKPAVSALVVVVVILLVLVGLFFFVLPPPVSTVEPFYPDERRLLSDGTKVRWDDTICLFRDADKGHAVDTNWKGDEEYLRGADCRKRRDAGKPKREPAPTLVPR